MYLIGYDIGSSSVKAALVDTKSGKTLALISSPKIEMAIQSPHEGWAEQAPELWWEHVCKATKELIAKTSIDVATIKSIGISYQMHGLVLVDKDHKVLRPAIIWCDSRAVELGNKAFQEIGEEQCLSQCLNSPGNFTASKLKWIKDNEPEIYGKIHKMMLPGDYIAMVMSGDIYTTVSGLSEGVLWDFKNNKVASTILSCYGIDESLLPTVKDTFSVQGKLTEAAAKSLGLHVGMPISYRAGDQPNNALSLGVINADEVAATGGTSGVVYAVMDNYNYDSQSRVNGFAHVNHKAAAPRIGQLLCINGAGILYAWMKNQLTQSDTTYEKMEKLIEEVSIGSGGLRVVPFGNGAERMIGNVSPGAQVNNLQFNRHTQAHLFRAGLEGIAFSFVYGIKLLQELGLDTNMMKVGNDNLFQSKVFGETIATLVGCKIEVVDTTGAIGAAKASGIGVGVYNSLEEAFSNNIIVQSYNPQSGGEEYQAAYDLWEKDLERLIS